MRIDALEKHCRKIAKSMLKQVGGRVIREGYQDIVGEGRVYRVSVTSDFPTVSDGSVITFKTRQAFKQWYSKNNGGKNG